jgi:serine/threonine protein phosphatase PrpC
VLRISGLGVSHVGLVRANNEDAGFVGPSCMLVADGVGGGAAGEVAAATTAYVVSAVALARHGDDPAEVLGEAVLRAQVQVAAGVVADRSRAGMATTLTALVTDGDSFALAHMGDSRGYVFRDGDLTSERRIADILGRKDDDAAVHSLLATALGAGGRDNVTCALATIIDGPPVPADGQALGALRDPDNVVDAAAVREFTA